MWRFGANQSPDEVFQVEPVACPTPAQNGKDVVGD
jgi:hypothetical protein